jgi:MerR family transcriptional regulator, light-induced transcriptional regulator
MPGLVKQNNANDFNGRDADSALRNDFLSAISKLPHTDIRSHRDLGLARTVEAEIIPRLMLAHKIDIESAARRPARGVVIDPRQVAAFGEIVLQDASEEAKAFVARLRASGASIETVLLDLMAPTARRLGEMWDEDNVDFTVVTIGLCCLQRVLRDVSGMLEEGAPVSQHAHRALLALAPGEQHIFSVLMVDEFFRRAGWDVWTMPAATHGELLDLVRRESFQIVGFSLSSEEWLPNLQSIIAGIRGASRNRAVSIMVGGRIFVENPDLAVEIGADGTAANGRDAVKEADRLVEIAREK